MSKWLAAVALVVVLPVAARAQVGQITAPRRTAAGHGVEVPGSWARPAAIFWDPQQTASGQYTAKAKFTVNRLPRFEEGYNDSLTAFLVREDG
jgi:hypothetical protein